MDINDVKQAFASYLAGIAAVADMVGDRVYPESVTQGDGYPRLVLSMTGGRRQQQLHTNGGAGWAHFGVECWGDSYEEASELARAVGGVGTATPLDEVVGAMGAVTVGCVLIEDAVDGYIAPVHGEGTGLFSVTIPVRIFYYE